MLSRIRTRLPCGADLKEQILVEKTRHEHMTLVVYYHNLILINWFSELSTLKKPPEKETNGTAMLRELAELLKHGQESLGNDSCSDSNE
ncbi:hypothetical protein C0J52_09500 [Blattella germanica]|nr:hypothetical protein C0J52_09500 [Blattella germanica]